MQMCFLVPILNSSCYRDAAGVRRNGTKYIRELHIPRRRVYISSRPNLDLASLSIR